MKNNVVFHTNGDGHWTRTEYPNKCTKEWLFDSKCQGVEYHLGDHWCYGPTGGYDWHRNDSDPNCPHDKSIACGTYPAGHEDWPSPIDKNKEQPFTFKTKTEVTDVEEIARLNRGEFTDDESVISPATDADIEFLKKQGLIKDFE